MFTFTHNLVVCALLGFYASAQSTTPGPCPKTKPFDFDPSKVSGKAFKLLYGELDSDGALCTETKFLPWSGGSNITRWQLNTGQRLPMSLIEQKPENEGQFLTFNNDEFILVFRDQDKEQGITNYAHVFRVSDLHDELNNVNHESPYNFHWTVLHTDYENELMMSACFEESIVKNAAGQTQEEVEELINAKRELELKVHTMPHNVKKYRDSLAESEDFLNLFEKMSKTTGYAEAEIEALQEATGDDNDLQQIVNDMIDLKSDDKLMPWSEIRELIVMPPEQLNELVAERQAKHEEVFKSISEKTYEYDNNYVVNETNHDHILQAYVSDLSKYQEAAALEKLKDSLFDKFEDAAYRKVIEPSLAKQDWSIKACEHEAAGKSIFDMEGIMNAEEFQTFIGEKAGQAEFNGLTGEEFSPDENPNLEEITMEGSDFVGSVKDDL